MSDVFCVYHTHICHINLRHHWSNNSFFCVVLSLIFITHPFLYIIDTFIKNFDCHLGTDVIGLSCCEGCYNPVPYLLTTPDKKWNILNGYKKLKKSVLHIFCLVLRKAKDDNKKRFFLIYNYNIKDFPFSLHLCTNVRIWV